MAKHPGPLFGLLLKEKGWKQITFCNVSGLLPSYVNEVTKGKRPIIPRLALAIEDNIPGESGLLWLYRQAHYDLYIERQARRKKTAGQVEKGGGSEAPPTVSGTESR